METNTKKSEYTQKGGMPLGILDGAAFQNTLKEETIQLEKGDRIILYTDGMVETMSPDYEEFGEDRFLEVINKVAIQRSDMCVKQILHSIISFQATAPQHDDLTLVTARALK